MANSYLKIKFPCGYEIECRIITILGHLKLDGDIFRQCPLHGKKCSQSKSKANKK